MNSSNNIDGMFNPFHGLKIIRTSMVGWLNY